MSATTSTGAPSEQNVRSRPLRIGMVCHATVGGSGVIATGLGHALARRGHQVHFICAGTPPRLDTSAPNLALHRVESPVHELFPGGEYALALASKLAELGPGLDLIHTHYAIPHAPAALLARQVLGPRAPKIIHTLHGTDVLTVGRDPAFFAVLREAVSSADALTVPTRYLETQLVAAFHPPVQPEVIGNFVDSARFTPAPRDLSRAPTLLHNSSFRPLKRIDDVVRIFAEVKRQVAAANLVLVGDGPVRAEIEALATTLGVAGAIHFAGEQSDLVPYLQKADVFLFPSETESFGLAALEAMACGVVPIASRTGGLPELITDGANGFLAPVGDISAFAARAVALLTDSQLHQRLAAAARHEAATRWQVDAQVIHYEALYRRVRASRGT